METRPSAHSSACSLRTAEAALGLDTSNAVMWACRGPWRSARRVSVADAPQPISSQRVRRGATAAKARAYAALRLWSSSMASKSVGSYSSHRPHTSGSAGWSVGATIVSRRRCSRLRTSRLTRVAGVASTGGRERFFAPPSTATCMAGSTAYTHTHSKIFREWSMGREESPEVTAGVGGYGW